MNDFEVYRLYLALKSHFSSSYDFFKYNGKVFVKAETFKKRNDKYYFSKLAKHPDPLGFLLSNFLHGDFWIGDIKKPEFHKRYIDWKKINESMIYRFIQDLRKLDPELQKNFIVLKNEHPHILKLVIAEEISFETFIILSDLIRFEKMWDEKIGGDNIWDIIKRKMNNYKPFMKYDKEKMKQIIKKEFFSENA